MARNAMATKRVVLTSNEGGRIEGTRDGQAFAGRLDLLIIRTAWNKGCNFEQECDGYGVGAGTNDDWSGIRDSSEPAIMAMLAKAMGFLSLGL